MKNSIYTFSLMLVIALLTSCAGSQGLSSYDDIYYSPKDEEVYASVDDEYIDIDDREYSDEYETTEKEVDEYYDPNYRSTYDQGSGTTVINNYYNDDYYYSNRMRRFNSNFYSGFGYYDPFYSYNRWNAYDPYGWNYNPYAFRPGFGLGWNSYGGWGTSLNYGLYGNYYPFAGYAYNPWPNYGGYYCPTNGFAYGDAYSSNSYYTGQYYSLGSFSSRGNSGLGLTNQHKALGPENLADKPVSTSMSSQALVSRPASAGASSPIAAADRPRETGVRPVESSETWSRPHVAGTRSSERPVANRPSTVSRPSSRPVAESPRDSYRPQSSQSTTSTPIRDDGNYRTVPSSTRPPRSSGTSYSRPARSSSQGSYGRSPRTNSGSSVNRSSSTTRSSSGSSTRSSTPSRSSSNSTRGTRSGGRR